MPDWNRSMTGLGQCGCCGGSLYVRSSREAVIKREKSYPLSYGVSYEGLAEAVGESKPLINGEPPGTRTQGPRLKRAMLYRLS